MKINLPKLSLLVTAASMNFSFAGVSSTSTSSVPGGSALPSPWEVTASVGLASTSGNSSTTTMAAQLLASYFEDSNELYLGIDYFYGDSDQGTTADTLRLFGQYQYLLSERCFWGVDTEWYHDKLADLDYRYSLVPKVGYYTHKSDKFKHSVHLGAGFQWEDQGGNALEYAVLALGNRLEYQITPDTKFYQSLDFVSQAEDLDNYRILAEVGVATNLSSQWGLKVFVRDTYDSTPSAGFESNDVALLTALTYSFGGTPETPAAPKRRSLWVNAPKPKTPGKGWDSSAALGLSLTRGNSENIAFTAAYHASYRTDQHETLMELNGAYGEDAVATTVQNANGFLQHNRFLGEKMYYGYVLNGLHDDVSDVSYRLTPAVVLGTYLIKDEGMKLSVEAGPNWTFEEVGGIQDDYVGAQVGERFEWKLSDRVSVKQSLLAIADPGDMDNYILRGDALLDVVLADQMALRTGLQVFYDNQPAAGTDETNTLLSSSIVYKF